MEKEILNLNLTAEQALEGTISSLNLNNFGIIYSALKKHENFHHFQNLVTFPEHAYFTAELNKGMRYELVETRMLKTDVEGIICYEFYLRVEINGTISEYDDGGITFLCVPFTLKAVARIHHFSSRYGVEHENLKLYNESQYRFILDEREIQDIKDNNNWVGLHAKTFEGQEYISFFTSIWNKPLRDPNDEARKAEIARHTSLNFLDELESAYSSLLFAATKAIQLKPYVGSFKDHYYLYQGKKQYYIERNLFLSRHLEYLSFAFAAAYTFWERLTFLMALHLMPKRIKGVSFFKMFDTWLAQLKSDFPSIAASPDLNWFIARVGNRHLALNKFRHPLIHYQYQENTLRGNMNADLFRLMLENISNEQELEMLFTNLDEAVKFIIDEIPECIFGFETTIKLISKIQEPI